MSFRNYLGYSDPAPTVKTYIASTQIIGEHGYPVTPCDFWQTTASNAIEALHEKFPTDMIQEVGAMDDGGMFLPFILTDGRSGELRMTVQYQ